MPVDYQLPSPPPAQVQPARPASFEEQYDKARALANGGQPGLAVAAYGTLLAQSPGNADVLLGRGIAYTRLERWAEARADLEAAAQAAPGYADVWLALGNLHQWNGRPEAALQAYGRLLALRPGDPAGWIARARANQALGRNAQARADLAQARAAGADGAGIDAAELDLQPQPARAANPEAAPADGYTWAAGLSGGWLDAGSGARWNDQTASVRRYLQQGSIGFETLRAQRFGQTGHAWALDAYVGLWSGAYANLRYQRAPAARLFPANAGRVELYQALGGGWEASLSEDVLGFDSRVNIHGMTLGKYTGNWYLQLRHQHIALEGSHSKGQRLLARYYYAGDADSYVEASVNSGRSDDPLSLSGARARSGGGSLTWVRYWSRDWGTRAGASVARGAKDARERGVSVGLYRRW